MNAQAHKFLSDRLSRLRHVSEPPVPDPPAVKAARKVIKAHDTRVRQLRKKFDARVVALQQTAREALFTGDYDKALTAVKDCERAVRQLSRQKGR